MVVRVRWGGGYGVSWGDGGEVGYSMDGHRIVVAMSAGTYNKSLSQ